MAAEVVKRKESVRGETSNNEGKKKKKNNSSEVVGEGGDGDLKKKKRKKEKKMCEDDRDGVVRKNVLGGTGDGKECLDEDTIVRAESSKKEKKTKKKERKEKGSICSENVDNDNSQVEGNGEGSDQKKKKRKKKKENRGVDCDGVAVRKNISGVMEVGGESKDLDANTTDGVEFSKKEKKKKKKKERQDEEEEDGVEFSKKEKKKKKKKERQDEEEDGVEFSKKEKKEGKERQDEEEDGVEFSKKEKKKKKKKERQDEEEEGKRKEKNSSQVEGNLANTCVSGNGVGDRKPEVNVSNLDGEHKDVKRKKRKRDKSGDAVVINREPEYGSPNEGGDGQLEVDAVVTQVGNKNERKRKKRKRDKHGDDVVSNNGTDYTNQVEGNEVNTDASGNEAGNRLEETTNMSEKSKRKRTSKRVTFSQDVEVFSPSEAPIDEEGDVTKELVRGKRFSLEEDEMIKKAVFNYIESHQLGEEGLEKVMNCTKHKIRNCWKEIGEYLPWRPHQSVYYRAHTLFQRDETHSWSPEELDVVRNYANKHAGKWKDLAAALGKNRVHVKDTWRRVRLANMKSGAWSQDEYQSLFDLVNKDMRMKVNEVKKTKHGMLRDNISWTAISTKLETRTDANCCLKWYDKLASPMVKDGKWFDTDDYKMVIALYDLDAFCIEDVDWDNLLEHRRGDICRKRWNQMVRNLGEHGNKPFSEQVEILSKRYCPDVLEAREAYNSNTAEDQSNTAEDCSAPSGNS